MKKLLALATVVALVLVASPGWPDIPHLINYQGMLTDDLGEPLSGSFDLTFRIFDDPTAGNQEWGETQYDILVSNGLFSVNLGDSTPINLPFDEDYWLEIEVEIYGGLSPRMKLTSVGYAYRAEWADTTDHCLTALRADTADYALAADTADYALVAAAGPGDNDWAFRITDTADTTLITGGAWGLARSGNILYGNADSTHVNFGVACTTGLSGQNRKYCTIGGGVRNIASGLYSTVGGGERNTASGQESTVGGGNFNTASDLQATVAGGYANLSSGESAAIGGGWHNLASGSVATVAGGQQDTASGDFATVAGGVYNAASGNRAAVVGGTRNVASGAWAFVGAGIHNTANGNYATVGGGWDNNASGYGAIVPGGYADTAAGDYSLAAGDSVRITSDADYTFAFGRDFTTSTPNAVIFHNSVDPIKVGIGTASPGADLDIVSANPNLRVGTTSGSPVITLDKASGGWGYLEFREGGASKWQAGVSSDNNYYILNWPASKYVFYANSAGNVGMGTTNPTGQLDVNGDDIRIRTSQTPASSSADGYTGEIAWDAGYIYICTSGDGPGGGTDTWKRAAISTW